MVATCVQRKDQASLSNSPLRNMGSKAVQAQKQIDSADKTEKLDKQTCGKQSKLKDSWRHASEIKNEQLRLLRRTYVNTSTAREHAHCARFKGIHGPRTCQDFGQTWHSPVRVDLAAALIIQDLKEHLEILAKRTQQR